MWETAVLEAREVARKAAGWFARRHGMDVEESLALADYCAVRAVRDCDPRRGTAAARARYMVRQRLRDQRRRAAIVAARFDPAAVADAIPARKHYSRRMLLLLLGRDGRIAVRLALHLWHPSGCWKRTGRAVREALAGLGWSPRRVGRAFREVREALG